MSTSRLGQLYHTCSALSQRCAALEDALHDAVSGLRQLPKTYPLSVWVLSILCCGGAVASILSALLRDYIVEGPGGIDRVVASGLTAGGIFVLHTLQILLVPADMIPTAPFGRRRVPIPNLTIILFTGLNVIFISLFARYHKVHFKLASEVICVCHAVFVDVSTTRLFLVCSSVRPSVRLECPINRSGRIL